MNTIIDVDTTPSPTPTQQTSTLTPVHKVIQNGRETGSSSLNHTPTTTKLC